MSSSGPAEDSSTTSAGTAAGERDGNACTMIISETLTEEVPEARCAATALGRLLVLHSAAADDRVLEHHQVDVLDTKAVRFVGAADDNDRPLAPARALRRGGELTPALVVEELE